MDIKFQKKNTKYIPLSKRQDKPEAILWLIKTHPQLSDGQVAKLVGSTKNTVSVIRKKNYWNFSNLSAKDPVVSNLCSQTDIKNAVDKAERKKIRDKKIICGDENIPIQHISVNPPTDPFKFFIIT